MVKQFFQEVFSRNITLTITEMLGTISKAPVDSKIKGERPTGLINLSEKEEIAA